MTEKRTAIQLFSGGLDSILAARIIANEGFDVVALHFYNGFNCATATMVGNGPGWKWEPDPSITDAANRLGIRLIPLDIVDEFYKILTNPRFGYGSGANPCIDCRIMILDKARQIMEEEQAAFVFTGEVIGQRPMSQNRNTMRQIEKHSRMTGYLLRPLSAKLLEPTIPEQKGIINRDHLYDIQGRSRKRQKELAEQFGIDFYPQPGGGCLLTDPNFSLKFHDLFSHSTTGMPTRIELESLKAGRHLRTPAGTKVIIGRTEIENDFLTDLLGDGYWKFEAVDIPGPTTVAMTEPADDEWELIAAITARYGKGASDSRVAITATNGSRTREMTVAPAAPDVIEPLLITQTD